MTKNLKKFAAEKRIFFWNKLQFTYCMPPKRTHNLQEKPSALRKEHPARQNMKILYFFLNLWVIFAFMDPDPATQINADPDPQPCMFPCSQWSRQCRSSLWRPLPPTRRPTPPTSATMRNTRPGMKRYEMVWNTELNFLCQQCCGSMTFWCGSGSGSCYFRHRPSRRQQKSNF